MFVASYEARYESHHEVRYYAKLYVEHMGCPGRSPGDFKGESWNIALCADYIDYKLVKYQQSFFQTIFF
jgi:hypothetical protein